MKPDQTPIVLYYRYTLSTWNSLEHGRPDLDLTVYHMVKRTPCGAWVSNLDFGANPRFVLDCGKKKFAYPTKEAAMYGFYRRMLSSVHWQNHKLDRAKLGLALAETELKIPVSHPEALEDPQDAPDISFVSDLI